MRVPPIRPPCSASFFLSYQRAIRPAVHRLSVQASSIVSWSFSSTWNLAVQPLLAHASVPFYAMYQVVLLIALPVPLAFLLLLWVCKYLDWKGVTVSTSGRKNIRLEDKQHGCQWCTVASSVRLGFTNSVGVRSQLNLGKCRLEITMPLSDTWVCLI